MQNIYGILLIGSGAILCGGLTLALIVSRDIGPLSGLRLRGRLLLALALGSGILTVSIKMLVIFGYATLFEPPSQTVRVVPVQTMGRAVWEAFPVQTNEGDGAGLRDLGRQLFFDPRLSVDGSVSCASCHDLERFGGADGRRVSVGIGGQVGRRNAPTVLNAVYQALLFWDGRARNLVEQAKGPLLNPAEMGNPGLEDVAARLRQDAGYVESFKREFPETVPLTGDNIVRAIAAFEQSLVTPDAPYDRFVRGDLTALTSAQQRGMRLFEEKGCIACHAGAGFSVASQLAAGQGRAGLRPFPVWPSEADGHYNLRADLGAARSGHTGLWRVPSLRNVELTAPYFHNGSVATLSEAVRVMAVSQLGLTISEQPLSKPVSVWDPSRRVFVAKPLQTISGRDIEDIVEFLRSLTAESARGGARNRPSGDEPTAVRP